MIKQYQIGKRLVLPESNQIICDSDVANIEPQAMAVLVVLLNHRGQVIDRERLIELAWKGAIVGDSSVNRIIAQLRKAFADNAKSPKYIETISKRGYRFKQTNIEDNSPTDADSGQVNSNNSSNSAWLTIVLVICAMAIVIWVLSISNTLGRQIEAKSKLTSRIGMEYEPSFSRDGLFMLYSSLNKSGDYAGFYLKSLKDNNTWAFLAKEDEQYSSVIFSPDSKRITYIGVQGASCGIYQISIEDIKAKKFDSKKLKECHSEYPPSMIEWGKDSNQLYIAEPQSKESPYQINLFDFNSKHSKQLTFPTNTSWGDRIFDFNEQTYQLAFIRWSPSKQQLFVLDTLSEKFEEYSLNEWGIKSISWSPLDLQLLLSWPDKLKILDIASGNQSQILSERNIGGATFMGKDNKIVISKKLRQSSTYSDNLNNKKQTKLFESDATDNNPIFLSGEGKIAFISNRSEGQQIWISDRDGNNQRQISSFRKNLNFGSLDWSARNRKIMAWEISERRIWLIDLDKGVAKSIFDSEHLIVVPRFSTEEQLITFGSNRSGDWDIWSIDLKGNNSQRITYSGGYYGQLDETLQALYFTKYHNKGLWRKQLLLNTSKLLIGGEERVDYSWWQIRNRKIYSERQLMEVPGIYQYSIDGELNGLVLPQGNKRLPIFDITEDASNIIYSRENIASGNIWLYE